jgi:hypothetical protein
MNARDLLAIASGFQASTVVLAANHLGILEAMTGTARTPADVSAALGLDARAVQTVCEALAVLGVLERDAERFRVTAALSGPLSQASPESIVEGLRHQWHLLRRWSQLDAVLRTGEPIPRPADDPEQLRAFILAMADLARAGANALWGAVDLGGRRHLVDVGGGPGELALAALERFPGLRATVFDLESVLRIAQEYAARRADAGRLGFVAGDALSDPIPACDVALVSSLVHSYGREEVERIAANVSAGVTAGGMVLIREFLWDDGAHTGPLPAALFAVNMLVGTRNGRCWTADELEAVFGAVGFGEWRLTRLDPRSSLLAGVRR